MSGGDIICGEPAEGTPFLSMVGTFHSDDTRF